MAAAIHSMDSTRLLRAVDEAAGAQQCRPDVLLEVNISGDAAKHGFSPDAMPAVVETLDRYENLHLCGLMTMASATGGRARAARDFEALRHLRDTLQPQCPAHVTLDELSMGMSRDFDLAIEQGSDVGPGWLGPFRGLPHLKKVSGTFFGRTPRALGGGTLTAAHYIY